ncbi:MAG: hypothetical protein F6J98_34075, partial [Moorea sp. SIO4G2]|nr:hypothetical protein [Moorena sp. SIO4G2]
MVLPVIPNSRFPIPYFLWMDINCSVTIRRTPGEHSPNIQQTVMTQEIDKIPVKDLQTRYNIGRTALYERIKHANIKPSKEGTRSFISGEQLKELDRLNDYLMTGRTFEDFEPLLTEEFTEDSQETISLDSSPNSSPNSSPDVRRTGSWKAEREALEVLIDAIASGIERANINRMK